MSSDRTNYFYYRRHLRRDLWIRLETYSYLMAKRFGTTLRRDQTGIYFTGEIDPSQSNMVVMEYLARPWPDQFWIYIKAKWYYPQEELCEYSF